MTDSFQKLILTADKTELNPLLQPEERAHLQTYGITEDGERIPMDSRLIRWKVQTIYTSGGADVLTVDQDGTVTPRNGGYACVEAEYGSAETERNASLKIVVRPFYHEYHKTLTVKLFLAMEPRDRAINPIVSEERDEYTFITFEEALDIIRRLDTVTYGIPKIVYLVGWQRGGHDHGYPDFGEVNPRLKRAEDATAADSLRWLIRESRKYHTAVSLHINVSDAWSDSPLWETYYENHIYRENEDGGVRIVYTSPDNSVRAAHVCQTRLWETGLFQKRIEELLEMLPELRDSHTIHIDNWCAFGSPALGITTDDDEEAIQKMFLYLREQGLDATSEGSFHGRKQPMTGLQPMSWWDVPYHPSVMPPSLYCGGRGKRTDSDPRFGETIHLEAAILSNVNRKRDALQGVQDEFCLYTLPWRFLNEFRLESFDGTTAVYENGVTASISDGVPLILWNDMQIRRGSTLAVPVVWKEDREILLYSFVETYYCLKLPPDWNGVSSVDLYYMDPLGREEPQPEITDYPIKDGVFAISADTRVLYSAPMLEPGAMYCMRPHLSET